MIGLDIVQVIGCAYTYQGSLGMRKRLTADIGAHHSSQTRDFSYFYKGDASTLVHSGEPLRLRRGLEGEAVDHWPEAELAILLGERHEALGYALANDFTAIGIEAKGRSAAFDGTYLGKVWPGSCAIGDFSPPATAVDDLEIRLGIERKGEAIYDNAYSTRQRKREFRDLPEMILAYRAQFGEQVPPSKRIGLESGYLLSGSVILAGTGLIVPPRCYSQKGDLIAINAKGFTDLSNPVA